MKLKPEFQIKIDQLFTGYFLIRGMDKRFCSFFAATLPTLGA